MKEDPQDICCIDHIFNINYLNIFFFDIIKCLEILFPFKKITC